MANKDSSKKEKAKTTNQGGDIHVGGSITGNNIIIGHNNTIIIDGKPVAFRTGWFYGHRYGDLAAFTGRADELNNLDDWLANDTDNLLLITAFGGFGKSALTWQWFNNRVDKTKWQTAVWWSFYEKESGFERFLAETLAHLGVEVKQSARLQLNDLLEAMRGTEILIVLDGFERLMRQYGRMDAALQSDDEDAAIDPSQRDCSSPLMETFLRGLSGAGMKSKVLMTTRLCPRVLESQDGKLLKGCRQENLQAFSPDDAVEYFHKEKINATRAEIIEVCSTYGYHPLSLSLLVGLINKSHEHKGDIVVAKNLDIFGDIKAKRNHVLKYAYESLSPERRDLLSKLSCFRGSMEYAVIKKVFDSTDLENSLIELRERGILLVSSHKSTDAQSPNSQSTKYDMHPIVRHYVYDHFTNEKRRKETHVGLAKYYSDNMPTTKSKAKTLEDFAPVIELYYHEVCAGNYDSAYITFFDFIFFQIYYHFGGYQTLIELLRMLFPSGEDHLPRLESKLDQAQALAMLANSYSANGLSRASIPLLKMSNELNRKNVQYTYLSVGLANMAMDQIMLGEFSSAETNLQSSIDLCRKYKDNLQESIAHGILGEVLSYRGEWENAKIEIEKTLKLAEAANKIQWQSVTWSLHALRFLLIIRVDHQSQIENLKLAIESAQHALELADETSRVKNSYPKDYVRAHWLLGAAYRANNDFTLAEENLTKALNQCRQINLVESEADILIDVARLCYAQGDFKDAQEKASEALVITERSGYVLQGADVNLFLAQYALEQEKDKAKAKVYAEEAKKLATCDGPPYYYKVAYEEAEAMLKALEYIY